MNLVIVESPAKGRTIERYLGKDYRVLASFGHVRDLPQKELGVDVERDFQPKYVIPPKAKKVISILKEAVSNAEKIYLATDYDREGEAIAWHVAQALGLDKQKNKETEKQKNSDLEILIAKSSKLKALHRITFHEITKEAIKEAVAHPRDLDLDLVNAQQARRILDRLVGYKLSPFLWHKVFKGLSAGRVQSVAVRLIVDRERAILAFIPTEYWDIKAKLKTKNEKLKTNVEFIANLIEKDGKKIEKLGIKSQKEAAKIIAELEGAEYKVEKIEDKEENRWPYPPFTTSTLQQESSKRLGFSAKQTMKLAQDLYEEGLITYMRTDSVNIAQVAINSTRKLIEEQFGEKYLPTTPRIYKTKTKGAQEAHEAIRPTYVTNHKSQITNHKLSEDHLNLYDLIWRRMVACQMQPMILATMSVDIVAKSKIQNPKSKIVEGLYKFRANGSSIKFDGFSKVWPIKMEEKTLPTLSIKEMLQLIQLLKEQHFTEPPARYTEASLIKALEEQGIGRPSTYAPTISTIQERGYVRLEKKVFFPQETGLIVTDLLVEHFPDIVDLQFTAQMEEDLDKIAEGKLDWVTMLQEFYGPFQKNLSRKEQTVEKSIAAEPIDKKCPKCHQPLLIKMGKFGKFIACSGFPNCKYTEQIINKIGMKCPDCQKGEVVERKTRKGKTFWGCDQYPKCQWASWNDPTKLKIKN